MVFFIWRRQGRIREQEFGPRTFLSTPLLVAQWTELMALHPDEAAMEWRFQQLWCLKEVRWVWWWYKVSPSSKLNFWH